MDDTLGYAVWVVGGTLAFAGVGAVFGAAAGALAHAAGHPAGTRLAQRVVGGLAELFGLWQRPLSRSAAVGGVDGALFLGVLGFLLGFVAWYGGHPPGPATLGAVVLGLVALATGALAFGSLGYLLVWLTTVRGDREGRQDSTLE